MEKTLAVSLKSEGPEVRRLLVDRLMKLVTAELRDRLDVVDDARVDCVS